MAELLDHDLRAISRQSNARRPNDRCKRAEAQSAPHHARFLKSLARVELLILDDWGLATLTPEQGSDILEIVEDRHNRGSTIVTSQLPVDHWHQAIANPTIADAILDLLFPGPLGRTNASDASG